MVLQITENLKNAALAPHSKILADIRAVPVCPAASGTAPAERSGDGALGRAEALKNPNHITHPKAVSRFACRRSPELSRVSGQSRFVVHRLGLSRQNRAATSLWKVAIQRFNDSRFNAFTLTPSPPRAVRRRVPGAFPPLLFLPWTRRLPLISSRPQTSP